MERLAKNTASGFGRKDNVRDCKVVTSLAFISFPVMQTLYKFGIYLSSCNANTL